MRKRYTGHRLLSVLLCSALLMQMLSSCAGNENTSLDEALQMGIEENIQEESGETPEDQMAPSETDELAEPQDSAEEDAEPVKITDVSEDDWYYQAFVWCEENGAFNNIPLDGRLEGTKEVDRGMFVTMLFNIFGSMTPESEEDGQDDTAGVYDDVSADDYYCSAIAWSAENSLVGGITDSSFSPDEPVTREQLMNVNMNLAAALGMEITIDSDRYLLVYSDRKDVSTWAKASVQWCLQEGLTENTSYDRLFPAASITRADAVNAIYKFYIWRDSVLAGGETAESDDADGAGGSDEEVDPSGTDKATELVTDEHKELQEQINTIARRYGAVGLSVAYIENGTVADTFAYGYATRDTTPMTAETKIRVASLSKILVGIATMLSCENGIMSLDGDISDYWGFTMGTSASGDVITPRSLLTHTSSLSYSDSEYNSTYEGMSSRLKSGSGIRGIKSGNIANWSYSNYGFHVLGCTVELANNMELDDILDEYLFDPLEIDASFYSGDVENTDLVATIYQSDGSVGRSRNTSLSIKSDGVPGSYGYNFSGGLTISAYDMGKIIALLANDGVYNGQRYLAASVVENLEYHEGNKTSSGFWQCQPLRYKTNAYGQDELYYHTGSNYGVYNLACYNPESGCGVVVLTSGASATTDSEGIYAVCGSIANLLLNR